MLAGCGPAVEYNYRLAATVDTPEGVKTGSSVIRITHYASGGLLKQGSAHFYGEAVPVDLGKRGVLFILLTSADDLGLAYGMPEETIQATFGRDNGGGDKAYLENARRMKSISGAHAVPRRMYPRFVWFPDMADPKSVQEADPDNLAATFGDGVQLHGLTVEITNDRRTKGVIEKYLPWFANYKGGYLSGQTSRPVPGQLYETLSSRDFMGESR